MVLIGEVVASVPRKEQRTGRTIAWRTTIRWPFAPGKNHLLFVDLPDEWPTGATVQIELELVHDPPVRSRSDEIDRYKAWREAVEDSLDQVKGGQITW